MGKTLMNHKKIYNPYVSFKFMVQDIAEIKERILSVLKTKGPSLPVYIAQEIGTSILFASAFLSELVSEKRVNISHMRVGSSPVYFLAGQESSLEKFYEHLKSKEKDAFLLLKEKKFLMDSKQAPAIRVALREIRDFAVPFKSGEDIVWRYFLVPESEFKITEKPIAVEIKEPVKPTKEIEKPLDIFEEKEKPIKKERKSRKKKESEEKNGFFARVKEFLSGKSMELKDIERFTKNEIILKVMENGQEKILVAYNKRKISDGDIVKAHKKISDLGLPFMVLGISEPTKKTSELIKAMKNLSSIHGLK